MNTETIHLNAREMIFLAAAAGAHELRGIADGFYGMEETEIGREIVQIKDALAARGYAQFDFDGNFEANAEILRLIRICAFYERQVAAEKASPPGEAHSLRFYVQGNEAVRVETADGGYDLRPASPASVHKAVLDCLRWEARGACAEDRIVLRTELLNKIKNADENEFDDTLGKKLLIDAGCNDAEAAVIRDGLCAKADYFSLTVARAADGESSGVSAVCSSNGSLMIAPVPPAGDDDGAGIEFRATGPERFRREASEILSAAGFPREGGDLT